MKSTSIYYLFFVINNFIRISYLIFVINKSVIKILISILMKSY